MAENPVLPGKTVTAPYFAGDLDASFWAEYLAQERFMNQISGGVPDDPNVEPIPPPVQLDEITITAPITPPISPPSITTAPTIPFQGPLPSPSPGGVGGGTTTPTTTSAPAPSRPPYQIPKTPLLRKLRFTVEQIAKALKPIIGNIKSTRPATPFSFLAESLLIGPKVADATLFKPRTSRDDTWTMLAEQLVTVTAPKPYNARTELTWTTPSPSLSYLPLPSQFPGVITFDELEPFAPPFVSPSPIGKPTPGTSDLYSPSIPPSMPTEKPPTFEPLTPGFLAPAPGAGLPAPGVPFVPAPGVSFAPPSFDTPSRPSFTMLSEPSPSTSQPKTKKCPPCTKSKETKLRTKCYVKLVKERRNSANDRSTKWRSITCQ